MKKNTSSILIIFLALLFAGLILIASYILKDSDDGQTVTHLLIAVWFSLQCIANRKRC
ncbi:MAG: hypothetical protein OSA89_09470 [Mariniblastus sp.]|nr:hypothetical protein [Mariniblastus sp.]